MKSTAFTLTNCRSSSCSEEVVRNEPLETKSRRQVQCRTQASSETPEDRLIDQHYRDNTALLMTWHSHLSSFFPAMPCNKTSDYQYAQAQRAEQPTLAAVVYLNQIPHRRAPRSSWTCSGVPLKAAPQPPTNVHSLLFELEKLGSVLICYRLPWIQFQNSTSLARSQGALPSCGVCMEYIPLAGNAPPPPCLLLPSNSSLPDSAFLDLPLACF
jgi:hypothetical protein